MITEVNVNGREITTTALNGESISGTVTSDGIRWSDNDIWTRTVPESTKLFPARDIPSILVLRSRQIELKLRRMVIFLEIKLFLKCL